MNQKQRNYATDKIKKILNEKVKYFEKKFALKEKKITNSEAICLLKKGKVKIRLADRRPSDNFHAGSRMCEFFDFSEHHKPFSYGEMTYDSKKVEEAVKPFREEYERVKDAIMLGDSQEALDSINAFAKFCK